MSQTLPRLARLWAVSLLLCAAPAVALAQISLGVSVAVAPPELPVYDQPPIPGDGYIWTPGYWAYGDDGYYWVPGTWVEPPQPEYLWTPGYWGWSNGAFIFNGGYWGRQVGYYGGVSYGFGYGGNGWEGGRWQDGHLFYNQAVVNVGTTHMNNVYNETIVNNRTNITRVSYNGGPGGTHAEATPQQQTYAHQTHLEATPQQRQHFEAARSDRSLLASVNHGKPAVAATARPGAFTGPNVVGARAAGAVHDAGRAPAARSSTAPMHTETPRPPARDEATSRPAQTSTRPAAERPEVARPEAARPEAARPEAARPEAAPRPAPREAAPREAAPAARPPAPAHEAAPREAPRPQPSREHQEPPRG